MRPSIFLLVLMFLGLGVGAPGEQAPVTTQAATPMPTTSFAGSLYTSDGTTSAIWVDITLTFVTTPLGTWALAPTPTAGRIGLGSISGTVGGVRSKRAFPTPGLEDT